MICPNKDSSLGGLVLLTAPAEGVSNLLVLLSEADLTLSVTVTCVVNFAAIGMLPLWTILFETRLYDEPGNVDIPFHDAFIMFGYMVLALTAGFVFHRKLPIQYHYFWTYLPSLTIFTLLFTIITEIYNANFIFVFITKEIFCEAMLLVMCGIAFGATMAFLCQQSNQNILILSLETGTRTTYFTSGLLMMSLQQPEADIAKTTAVLVTLLTLIPAFMLVCLYRMYRRYTGHDFNDTNYNTAHSDYSEEEVEEDEEDEGRDEDGEICHEKNGCGEKDGITKCLPAVELVDEKETCI